MPFMWELPTSGSGSVTSDTASLDALYFLQGLSDTASVVAYAVANTPISYYAMIRQEVKPERVGPAEWFVTVHYATIDPQRGVGSTTTPDVGGDGNLGASFSFDTTGQSVHVTQSLATVSKTTAAGTQLGNAGNAFTLDNARAIGVNVDRVEGTDKFVPQFQWQFEARWPVFTGAQMVVLANLTGTVNAAAFKGFDPGSTLFLGATGRYTFNDGWTVTYKFASLPTQLNVSVGNGIVVPQKRGWEYLWVGYLPTLVIGLGGGTILQVPVAAYVEQVYSPADFSLLGIGG